MRSNWRSTKRFLLPSAWLAAAFSIALTIALPTNLAAEPHAPAGRVLVLRNGNVLVGEIEKIPDAYRIDLEGATFRVPADQVETWCNSLQDAYETRRAQRIGAFGDGHVELAAWCLRQNLVDQAARELLDGRRCDPANPSLAALDLQLQQALAARTAAKQKASSPHAAIPSQPPERRDRPQPRPDDENASLDASPAAQAQFVRGIQPMLIHNCATGGCHQANSPQALKLDRWALDGNGNPNLFRRNLASVLSQILKSNPEQSPLLQRARVAHGAAGGRSSPPLDVRRTQLLAAWVEEVVGAPPAKEPADPAASVEVDSATVHDEFDPAGFNADLGETTR